VSRVSTQLSSARRPQSLPRCQYTAGMAMRVFFSFSALPNPSVFSLLFFLLQFLLFLHTRTHFARWVAGQSCCSRTECLTCRVSAAPSLLSLHPFFLVCVFTLPLLPRRCDGAYVVTILSVFLRKPISIIITVIVPLPLILCHALPICLAQIHPGFPSCFVCFVMRIYLSVYLPSSTRRCFSFSTSSSTLCLLDLSPLCG
jgi:hypothetical protein